MAVIVAVASGRSVAVVVKIVVGDGNAVILCAGAQEVMMNVIIRKENIYFINIIWTQPACWRCL